MKLRHRPLPLSILLLQLTSLATIATSQAHVANLAEGKVARDVDTTASLGSTLATSMPMKPVNSMGKKDAPVDGKDGRPHAGPWVETDAQRDRKKAKEVGEDEVPKTGGKKPGPKEPSKPAAKGWDQDMQDMPESNDGVMDDPNRVIPKEGTRGTEGGISEKSRERLGSLDGQKNEKTPEEPKEVPPLPHSEQEKLSVDTESSKKTENEVEKPDSKVEDLELGGLTVSHLYTYKKFSILIHH